MRIRLTVLLAAISLCGAAQHLGGMPAGHGGGGNGWGNPFPMRPPFPGTGKGPWLGGRRNAGFGPNVGFGVYPGWFNTPLCASPLFPLAPSCSFGDVSGGDYEPPPPANPAPTINVIVPPAPPPVPLPIPIMNRPSADALSAIDRQAGGPETFGGEAAGSQEAPGASATVGDDCPPLIVLKTGGMYSITRYWVKKSTLYFETTAGDTLYAPLTSLDRMMPGCKAGRTSFRSSR